MPGVALVTGAAGGIGSAIAERLHADGRTVLVADVDVDGAQAVVDRLGDRARAIELDVTRRDQWREAIAAARELGGLAVTVNNAGIVRDASLRKMTDEQWDRVVDVHLRAAFIGCQESLREMVDRECPGAIVNLSSLSYLGAFGQANYAAAKGGIVSLSRTVALEGARYGVRCNAVAPGGVDTPMLRTVPDEILRESVAAIPLKRFAAPAEIAAVVRFLASDDAGYVTGQVIHVDGGISAGA